MITSDTILARLLDLHPREIDLSLGRVERLLKALGNPERHLPPVIHVAGTNGKGSTIAFMRAMLEAEGKTVHVYTSPHLVRFHERIRLGGVLVDEALLAETLEEAERVNAGAPITFFEITTAAAFLLFSRHPADVLLLEVGLGGRLDATNVVEQPLATIITPVSQDHARFLGEGVAGIAAEKAGIIKRGVPVIVSSQPDDAFTVIERTAARMRAPLLAANQDWHVREDSGRLVFEDEAGLLDLPLPRLNGRHQIANAGTAIAALRACPALGVGVRAMEQGLQTAEWPGRLQRLTHGRLVERMPDMVEIWLDGGHNPDGGRVIAEAMAAIEERVPRPLVLIAGMLDSKDSAGFLEAFAGLANGVYAVPVSMSPHGRPPEEIAAVAAASDLPVRVYPGLEEALADVAAAGIPARVLITGSLYLAGETLAANGTPPT